MKRKSFIQPNGKKRTKGIRNPHIEAARAPKGGALRDRRERRMKDAKRSFLKEDWGD